MSIMELGALGEFLGSIGVIATLIYLAVQIRQNTRSLDEAQRLAIANAYQARANDFERHNLFLAGDQELSELAYRSAQLTFGTDDERRAFLASLSANQRSRLTQFMNAQLARIDNLYFQQANGFVDERFWEYHKPVIEGLAHMWRIAELGYGHPDFRDAVGMPARGKDIG